MRNIPDNELIYILYKLRFMTVLLNYQLVINLKRPVFYVSISGEDPGILPVNFRRLIVWGSIIFRFINKMRNNLDIYTQLIYPVINVYMRLQTNMYL